MTIQTVGFISDYVFLDFSSRRISTGPQMFDAGVSFSNSDFGVNFYKGYFHHGFIL